MYALALGAASATTATAPDRTSSRLLQRRVNSDTKRCTGLLPRCYRHDSQPRPVCPAHPSRSAPRFCFRVKAEAGLTLGRGDSLDVLFALSCSARPETERPQRRDRVWWSLTNSAATGRPCESIASPYGHPCPKSSVTRASRPN